MEKQTEYKGKPFTKEDREQSLKDITPCQMDDKRTVCNVVRLIFQSAQDEAYNLGAIRDMIDNGTLMSVAMLRDGSFETFDGDLDWGEVTAPQDQKFLDDINKKFKTKFKMDDFAGR